MNRELRVLLLEDNPLNAELAVAAVTRELAGKVVATSNRAQFEEALQKQKPDIIVLDQGAIDFSGLAALQYAKGLTPEVPVVFCAGESPVWKVTEALQAGATSWVKKDSTYAGLLKEIRRLLGR